MLSVVLRQDGKPKAELDIVEAGLTGNTEPGNGEPGEIGDASRFVWGLRCLCLSHEDAGPGPMQSDKGQWQEDALE